MSKSYPEPESGEWVRPARIYHMMCCDCGLVHKIEFRSIKNRVHFRVWRANRRTGQVRRWRNIKVKRVYAKD